jgi:hypothetical protein
MPKDVEIVEGGPVMDAQGEQFQKMLAEAKAGAVENLAVVEDKTMAEDSSVAPTVPPETPPGEKLEDVPGDDIGNLKDQVTGLQAELSRVRKQKTGSIEEASSLKERIADMEGQIKVLREKPAAPATPTLSDRMKDLPQEAVTSNYVAWTAELSDAQMEAKLASRDRDPDALREAQGRVATATKMLEAYETEKDRRATEKVTKQTTVSEEHKGVASDLDTLFSSVYKAVPEMQVKDSPIWKAGQTEYNALPHLMKQLGPMGELIAFAAAIAKNPTLVGKKVTTQVLDNIEKAADKAFQKGGAAPSGATFKPVTAINSQADLLSFEEQVRRVKGG